MTRPKGSNATVGGTKRIDTMRMEWAGPALYEALKAALADEPGWGAKAEAAIYLADTGRKREVQP